MEQEPVEQHNISVEERIRQQFMQYFHTIDAATAQLYKGLGRSAAEEQEQQLHIYNAKAALESGQALTRDQKEALHRKAYPDLYVSQQRVSITEVHLLQQAAYEYFVAKKPRRAWEILENISNNHKSLLKLNARFLMGLIFQQCEKELKFTTRELVKNARISLNAAEMYAGPSSKISEGEKSAAVQSFFYAIERVPSWEKDVFRTYAASKGIIQQESLTHLYVDGNPGNDLTKLQFLDGVDAYIRYKIYQGLRVHGFINSIQYVTVLNDLRQQLSEIPCEMISKEELVGKIKAQRFVFDPNLRKKEICTEDEVSKLYQAETAEPDSENEKLMRYKETALGESKFTDYWRAVKGFVFDPKDEGVFWTIASPVVYFIALAGFVFYSIYAAGDKFAKFIDSKKDKSLPSSVDAQRNDENDDDILASPRKGQDNLMSVAREVSVAKEVEVDAEAAVAPNQRVAQNKSAEQKKVDKEISSSLNKIQIKLTEKKIFRPTNRYASMRNKAIHPESIGFSKKQKAPGFWGSSGGVVKVTVPVTHVPVLPPATDKGKTPATGKISSR